MTSGGNEENSTLRIVSYFKKDHSTADNAEFLQQEYRKYGSTGKGFIFSGNHVSVWFEEKGIRIAVGDTVLTADASLITWEQAAWRIRELLDMGRYMPQSELDKVDGLVLQELAQKLYFLYRDDMGSLPQEWTVNGSLHADSVPVIAEQLANPQTLDLVIRKLDADLQIAQTGARDEDFRWVNHFRRQAPDILHGLQDLQRESLTFTADESVSAPRPGFITQDEVDRVLAGGGQVENGKYRIYSYFLQEHTAKEKADFLKHEYGTGGGSRTGFDEWHDSKGIAYSRENNHMPYDKVILSWPKVARRIDELIADGRYMSEAQLAHLPEYEKDFLAGEVYSFFPYQPEDLPRPFPYKTDYSDGKKIIRSQLDQPERVAEILTQMTAILENTADFDRNYERMSKTFNDLEAYQNGTFSLFTPAKKEQPTAPAVQKPTVAMPSPTAEYDLQLGTTVYIGADEYEIYSLDDAHVVLRDINAPLFTKDMPRVEFDRKLRENRLNDSLIKINAAPVPEPETEQPYIPKKGDRYEIQGRQFVVDSVDMDWETVSLRDITFEGNTGFPIFRSESLEFIRMYDPIRPEPQQTAQPTEPETTVPNQHKEGIGGLKSIVIDLSPSVREVEPAINFPGEVEVVQDHIPRYTVKGIAYVDVISSNPQRFDIADKTHAYGVCDNQNSGRYLKNDDGSYVAFDIYAEAAVHAEQLNAADSLLTPSWEKPKPKDRAQTFDPHPEVPMSECHNFVITDDNLGHGGAKAKFHNNVEAIKTLRAIEMDNRFATPEEQEILSRYVGWGGLPQAFDKDNAGWTNEYVQLKNILTGEEYTSARSTTLNAHYTSPIVIKAIYKAIENMGFKSGNILDPGCGIGNFQGLLPDSMNGSKVFGVEIDPITGRIAQQLYQKNSIAIQGYENTALPDSFFDLAVGNVPFGGYGVSDKKYDKHKFLVHDYFFAKTLDKVRPGGIVAFVTSKGTMDKQNSSVRKYVAQRADLLGAIRLPNTAFKDNAGTEVTTDIIFLQKRDRLIDIEPDWVHLGETENGVPVNSYFVEHPDMILGEMIHDDMMYGNRSETTCKPFPDSDLVELLDGAIQNIHAEIIDYEVDELSGDEDKSIPADPNVRNFSYTAVDRQIYFRENSRMTPVEVSVTGTSRIKGMIAIRDCARTLIEYQSENYPDTDIQAEQAKLNRLYDSFSRKYGLINSRANSMVFSGDSAYPLLCSLEVLDETAIWPVKRICSPNAPSSRILR